MKHKLPYSEIIKADLEDLKSRLSAEDFDRIATLSYNFDYNKITNGKSFPEHNDSEFSHRN
jgi:hypothetical protein